MDHVRFQRAKHLLATTTYKLDAISGMLGFGTAANSPTPSSGIWVARPANIEPTSGDIVVPHRPQVALRRDKQRFAGGHGR